MPKAPPSVLSLRPKAKSGGGAATTMIAGIDPKVSHVQAAVKTVCDICGGCGCSACKDGWVEKPWVEENL